MRNRVSATIVVLWSLTAGAVLSRSQSPASATTLGKIGVINIQEAIATTAEGKKALAEIQKKYQPQQQELQRQQQEINALQDQLQRQSTTLSEEEQRRLSRELEEKQKSFKRKSEDVNADYQGETQEAVQRIGQKMVRLMNEYAQQNGYLLIMEAGPQMPIYYVAPQINLTAEIVKRYDAANPAGTLETPGAGSSTVPPPRPAAPASKTTANPKPAEKPKP